MSDRQAGYQFIPADTQEVERLMVSTYEQLTGVSLQPASPEKLFIQFVAAVVNHERALTNFVGSQNVPSRAMGENLDALSELFYAAKRPEAQPAVCTERFEISAPQDAAVLIPSGTRVTDSSNTLTWATLADAYIDIGSTYVDVAIQCQTAGLLGNDYAVGQIDTIVDLYDYYSACHNVTVSDGGSDRATDDEYYDLMRASMDAYSCAGSRGSYIYFAKQVSREIADVAVLTSGYAQIDIYALMNDGTIAGEETKKAILAACSAETVRPLTDYVSVKDPQMVEYDIDCTYYVPKDSPIRSADIQAAVNDAVQQYVAWQCGKLGRDINPSKLIALLMAAGIKRVDLTEPIYTPLSDGSEGSVPQVAKVGNISVTNGGLEDE